MPRVACSPPARSGAMTWSRELAQRFPDEVPATLTRVVRCALALVQVPPRGLWSGSGKPTYSLFDDWAGPGEPALTGDDARAELVRLYLRGFGPATVAAIQMGRVSAG